MKRSMVIAAVLTTWLGPVSTFGDAATSQKARAVYEKHKDCVVLVSATVKIEASGGGRSLGTQEGKRQVLGTVIDASGLTVVSLSAIDPAVQMQGRVVQGVKVTAKSELSDVKIELPDGTEITSRIVLKDEDLDLAFLVPEKKDEKLSALALQPGKAPEVKVLDNVVCLARMGKAFDQTPAAALSEISAIVKKPRLFYMGGRNLGGPVFTLEGQLVGITVAYKIESEGAAGSTVIILPTQDVMEIAKQALAKKDQPATSETTTTAPAASPAPTSQPAETSK